MSNTIPRLEEAGDAELISAVRDGDTAAYGLLFERHVDAARRLARQLVPPADADDLVAEAFTKVLAVLQRGGGPDLAFRAYLLTSIRRLQVDRARAGARLTPTDDLFTLDTGEEFQDTAVAGFENAAVARAFASLPERWQQVLWHTEVEGQKPAEVAPLLGMSANSVSALAYRAREGLRQAFVSMHAQDAIDDACATTRANLGSYIRNGCSRRDAAKVEEHLSGCMACSAIYLELTEVNDNLGALLAPLVLGGAAAAYLGAGQAGLLTGLGATVGGWASNARNWVVNDPVGKSVVGVAAASALVVAGVAGLNLVNRDGAPITASPSATPSATAPANTPSTAPTEPGTSAPTTDSPSDVPSSDVPSSTVTEPTTPASDSPNDPTPSDPGPKPNSPPVITAGVVDVTGNANGPVTVDVTSGVSDADGDSVRVTSARVLAPAHGTVRIGGIVNARTTARTMPEAMTGSRLQSPSTTITYTPDRGWRGTDTVAYVLTDSRGATVDGTLRIRTPNADPTAIDDTLYLHSCWSDPCAPAIVGVLTNDRDVNLDILAITGVGPAKGSAGGSVAVVDRQVVYTPAPRAIGSTSEVVDRFAYTISDQHGGRSSARVTVRVGQLPNSVPTAEPAAGTSHWSSPITLTPSFGDADGDALSLSATDGAHGTVTVAGTELVYTPTGAWTGTDSFTYTVSDGISTTTASAAVTLTNTAPGIADSVVTIGDDETFSQVVPTTDTDGDPLVVSGVDGASLVDRTLTWTPPFGADTDHTVVYTVSDGISTATVTIDVRARMPRSTLGLTRFHQAISGSYQAHQLTATGIPSGRSVRVHLDITGATGWPNSFWETGSAVTCPPRPAIGADGEVHVTCVLRGDGDFMHVDFFTVSTWSMDVRLEAIDFDAADATLHLGS